MEEFKKRRDKLASFIENSAILIGAYPIATRNLDVPHPFRQDSSLYYLTGFEEEESVFLFRPGKEPETVLFVRPKDEVAELWDGKRYGVEGAKEAFQMDACYSIYEIEEHLIDLLLPVEKVYYQFHKNPELDKSLLNVLEEARRSRGRTGLGQAPLYDSKSLVGELRLFKDAAEIENLKKAAAITCEGHKEAMRFASPSRSEREVEAVLSYIYQTRGSPRHGYSPIVASGKNATVLHYNTNNEKLNDFDLLLIDSGAEYNYYTADVTRTFPVNGMFSSSQKDFYQAVLDCQKAVIEKAQPGTLYKELHELAKKLLSQSIADLGLIKESADTILNEELFKKYFPHGTGHWLGLDVHDEGAYLIDGESRVLEEGMCFTVEPGLYVNENDSSAPEAFRGMGVRIEDNILMGSDRNFVLTKYVPKEIHEIEALMKEESPFAKI